jgi:hypothetical protein
MQAKNYLPANFLFLWQQEYKVKAKNTGSLSVISLKQFRLL